MTSDGHFHTRTYLETDVVLAFEHKANKPEEHPFPRVHDFYLREVRGFEALSRPYEYEVFIEGPLESVPERAHIAELLHGRAYVAWGPHAQNSEAERVTWGALSRFELVEVSQRRDGAYWAKLRIVLVPTVWRLSQTVRTGIFHEQSTQQIVKAVLGAMKPAFKNFSGLDRLAKPPAPREYTVQYQESDLDFVARLLEHEGIFYLFEHGEGGEVLVFGDGNAALPGSDEATRRQFRWGSAVEPGEEVFALDDVRWRDRTAPGTVRLRDFDYRQASAEMSAEAKLEAGHALGEHGYFGEHFRTGAEGKRVAAARLDGLWAEQLTLEASSRAPNLRAGERITVDAHVLGPEFDCKEWVVVRVEHGLRQFGSEPSGRAGEAAGYGNRFVAVPLREKAVWRPPHTTPKPKIYGLMTAKVVGDDAEPAVMKTPLDAEGRYRVQFPWPAHGLAAAGPSRWVRRVQMANGPDYGMHFPIHAETEVVIAHLDGDPDRPVIVGSVPNADHKSPVTSANSTEAIFRTKAGVHVIIQDETG